MRLENMVMKVSGPTIMAQFSVSLPAPGEELYVGLDRVDQCGKSAVLYVAWLEIHGVKATLISECWKPLAPNIYAVMSPKK